MAFASAIRQRFAFALLLKIQNILRSYRKHFWWYVTVFIACTTVNVFASYMYYIKGTAPAVILAPQCVALAAALIFGYRVLPFTTLATFLVLLPSGNPLPLVLLAVVANIAQLSLTLYILDTLKIDRLLKNSWDFYIFIGVAALTSTIVPTMSVLGRVLYNSSAAEPVSVLIWGNLWVAGLVGALIITPFLVRLLRPFRNHTRWEWIENLLAVLILNIPTAILTYTPTTSLLGVNLLIPFCVILMWIALRGGTFFVTLAMLTVTISAISGRILGSPPNPEHLDLAGQIVAAETSLIVFTLVFYLIAALEENRRAATLKLKEYTEVLEKSVADKDREARAKNEFISILGHELRNPLAPIVSSVELLRLTGENPHEVRRLTDVIGHQTDQLRALLNDLLDVSRIMHGNVRLSQREVKLKEIVSHALETVMPSLQRAQHTIDVTMPEDDIVIFADPVRLEQILVNLLDNATKYTAPRGKIAVAIALDEKNVRVSVKDSGVGIPADMLEKIFDPFIQLRDTKAMSNGGLGVGLMLSRNLARLHGGDLSVTSAGKGHGSEFTLSIPTEVYVRTPFVEYERGVF